MVVAVTSILLNMNTRFFVILFLLLISCLFCHAQNWDIDILKEVNLHRDKALDYGFLFVTNWAAPLAYSVPVFLFLFSFINKNRSLRQKSIYVITATLIAALSTTIIKHIVNRKRPYVVYPFIQKIATGGSPSFPSGHTSDAFTMAASLSIAFPKWYVIVPSYAWAIAVGYSRMDLGVHYPSDVLASIILATFWAIITHYWFTKKKPFKQPGDASMDQQDR